MAGINTDGFKLVQTRRRNAPPAPGVGRKTALSTPSTPPVRQRRLLVKFVEKGRRVGASDCTLAKIRDGINSASNTTKFAYAEYNRKDDLVLTTVGNLPAEPALANIKCMTKALNDMGIFGFNIGLDTPTVNIVINSIPLATSGDRHWTPEEWNIDARRGLSLKMSSLPSTPSSDSWTDPSGSSPYQLWRRKTKKSPPSLWR